MLDTYRLVEPEELSLAQFVRLGEELSLEASTVREGTSFAVRIADWMANATPTEISQIQGVGMKRARLMKTAFLLGTLAMCEVKPTETLTSPCDVVRLLKPELVHRKQECFLTVLLNTRNKVLGIQQVFMGSLDSSIAHPREILRVAIKASAKALLLVHNHPSGDPEPSSEDMEITSRMAKAGKVIGIHVLDHIVIGRDGYYSFKEHHQI